MGLFPTADSSRAAKLLFELFQPIIELQILLELHEATIDQLLEFEPHHSTCNSRFSELKLFFRAMMIVQLKQKGKVEFWGLSIGEFDVGR